MTPQEREDAEVVGKLQALGKGINKELPFGWGFVLLAFPYGHDGRLNYISNSERGDVVRAMYEFIEATKAKWGEHVADTPAAKEDEVEGRLRQRIAELEGMIVGLSSTKEPEVALARLFQEIERIGSR